MPSSSKNDPGGPGPEAITGAVTEAISDADPQSHTVRRFHLTVLEGPKAGERWESSTDRCSIGSHPSNDLVLDDPTVSRFHCELQIDSMGTRVRDLDSKNGLLVDGVPVVEAFLRGGSLLRIGRTVVSFQFVTERVRLAVSERSQFGKLTGRSVAMRSTFALLERAAASDATVLIEGPTGTGKEGAAESLWQGGPRKDRPFIVIDCSSIPGNLLESELFGHEKGSFTGAATRRIGAFEEASGGTIFLDEVGELPLELQPKLLRVLEAREVRRVGSNVAVPIDVRLIAATNRDLRSEVNAGRFRSDLYFRLAVVKVTLPPLSARPEDIPALVEAILPTLAGAEDAKQALRSPEFISSLQRGAWPGNVRELRNYLERCVVLAEPLPVAEEMPTSSLGAIDATVSFEEARRRVIGEFERRYIEELLKLHGGKVPQAARAAGVDKAYVYRLMRRYGFRSS